MRRRLSNVPGTKYISEIRLSDCFLGFLLFFFVFFMNIIALYTTRETSRFVKVMLAGFGGGGAVGGVRAHDRRLRTERRIDGRWQGRRMLVFRRNPFYDCSPLFIRFFSAIRYENTNPDWVTGTVKQYIRRINYVNRCAEMRIFPKHALPYRWHTRVPRWRLGSLFSRNAL